MSKEEAKQHVAEICRRLENSNPEVLDSLAGAIDRLQKAFPRRGHFLMEFIQNADDACERLGKSNRYSLLIETTEDLVEVFNNGCPFSREDVESICKVGRSSKEPQKYMGYLGVGFKSVFLVSNSPMIVSGEYQFGFDMTHWRNPRRLPWQIMPIWMDDIPDHSKRMRNWNTLFALPLKPETGGGLTERIREQMKPENLNSRILLFLPHLTEIETRDKTSGSNRRIVRSQNLSRSRAYEIYELEDNDDNVLTLKTRWLLFRYECNVPKMVREDWVSRDWERENVMRREVLVAFRLDDENNLIQEKGTAHIGVFSFVPLREVPSGLRFLVQADFLTAPGREVIHRESLWNEWLAQRIHGLITKICIPAFLKNKRWKMNFTSILHSDEGEHPLFDEHIKSPLADHLNIKPVLIAEDGTPIKREKAISIGQDIRRLLTDSDLRLLWPGKNVLHKLCKTELEFEEGPEDILDFVVEDYSQRIIHRKARSGDVTWFKKLYSLLSAKDEDELKEALSYKNVILTANKKVKQPKEVYIPSKRVLIPKKVEKSFSLVNPHLLANRKVRVFLRKLNIERLTKEHLRRILETEELPKIRKSWKRFSNSKKIEKTALCKELWEKGEIKIADLTFLTLRTKGKKWASPEDVIFSKEYKPKHQIEGLFDRKILKPKDLRILNIDFVSPEYLCNVAEYEIPKWRNFFEELGVGKGVDEKKIVQRVGINMALLYERNKRRKRARELPRSEEFGGYDIEGGERLIEAKGRKDAAPAIWLTPTQIKRIHTDGERYFIYVTRDALRNPTTSIVKGPELLEVESSASIEFYKWRNLSEEEYQL